MLNRSASLDVAVGILVALVLFAGTWVIFGFVGAAIFWLLLAAADTAIHKLLRAQTDVAKLGALVLLPSVIFLWFLPSSVRNVISKLRERESKAPSDSGNSGQSTISGTSE